MERLNRPHPSCEVTFIGQFVLLKLGYHFNGDTCQESVGRCLCQNKNDDHDDHDDVKTECLGITVITSSLEVT